MPNDRTFVGFGFGPIQSALFVLEAWQSTNFDRFVVCEVDRDLVQAVRENGGGYTVNLARPDGIDQVTVGQVEIYNPLDFQDRHRLVEAICNSNEIATALPSVELYGRGGETSVASILAEGLTKQPHPTIIYAAENHNHAAENLSAAVEQQAGRPIQEVQFLNTVIGKMSGVIDDRTTIEQLDLAPLTPDMPRAVLVEEFNHILISRIVLDQFKRGINVFVEKENLLPFEESKLYGHNAIHALIGYLAHRRGLLSMHEVAEQTDIMETARVAFLDESGASLVQKYGALNDPLFTPKGYRVYVQDLLQRMVNPYLHDLVDRVIRDPRRKLGYNDRFFGAMHLALQHGIEPRQLARGAAAAAQHLLESKKQHPDLASVQQCLRELWGPASDAQTDLLIQLTCEVLKADIT